MKRTDKVFILILCILLILNVSISIFMYFYGGGDSLINSFEVQALIISFASLSITIYFSRALYNQSERQKEINDKLPKKDDTYIINNYALIDFEKEVSFFNINDEEKRKVINDKSFFSPKGQNKNLKFLNRVVFLLTESFNKPVSKITSNNLSFSKYGEVIYKFYSEMDIDCHYSFNVLNRGYNCIYFDLLTNFSSITEFILSNDINEINFDINVVSVFNVCFNVRYRLTLDKLKDVTLNPDVESINDLQTIILHHSNYEILSKSIKQISD